jgi:hypothetical protein
MDKREAFYHEKFNGAVGIQQCGYYNLTKYMIRSDPVKDDINVSTIVAGGHLRIFRLFHQYDKKIVSNNPYSSISCAKYGHLKLFAFIISNTDNPDDIIQNLYIMRVVITNNRLDILKMLFQLGLNPRISNDYLLSQSVRVSRPKVCGVVFKYLIDLGLNDSD